MPGDFSINIGGQKYSVNNLPESINLDDVKNKRMQATLKLFDSDQNGTLSGNELANVSLFFKQGNVRFNTQNGNEIVETTISAKKKGKMPNRVTTNCINEKDQLVKTEDTVLDRNVKPKVFHDYSYTHNEDGSTTFTHDRINKNDTLEQTDVYTTNTNGVTRQTDSYEYKTKDHHVDVKHTKYQPDGKQDVSTYDYYTY